MRNLSVFQTLFYGITVVIGLMVVGAYLLISDFIEDYSFEQVEQSLYHQTLVFSSFMEREQSFEPYKPGINLDILEQEEGERFTIISKSGVVLYDSDADPAQMDNHANRPEVLSAIKNGWGSSRRYSQSIKKDMIYVARKVELKNGNYGFVRVSLPLKEHLTLLTGIRITFIEAFLIAGLLGLLVAYFFSRSFARRIGRISNLAIAIADQDLEFETEFKTLLPKELNQLVEALKDTAKRMQKLFKKVNREKQKLKGIIEDITQGLVVISKKNFISLVNSPAKQILGDIDKQRGKFWEVLPDSKIVKTIKHVQKTHETTKLAWQSGTNYYDVHLKYFPKVKETFIIFNDITEFVKLENIKREFVANVSHELRTPLTAIKGFLEGVEEGKPFPENHLGIIRRNTDRLIAMVEDLLSLSELENNYLKLHKESFDLASLIYQIIDVFSAQADEKGIDIIKNVPDSLFIWADIFKIEAILFNLLSNAIKYTEKGKIIIILKEKKKWIVLTISDSGIGIPEEAHEKIFERFYVVNKSRSRKSGGTGLGLSIVKHIVRLHDGRIEVKSKKNKGSEFTLYLPVMDEKGQTELAEYNKKLNNK